MSEVAVIGSRLTATPNGSWVAGTQTIIPNPTTTKVCDKFTLGETLNFVSSGCSFPAHTHSAGSGVIIANSICKIDNKMILLKGDKGLCNGIFINNSSGASVSCVCQVEISDAGQNFVKSN